MSRRLCPHPPSRVVTPPRWCVGQVYLLVAFSHFSFKTATGHAAEHLMPGGDRLRPRSDEPWGQGRDKASISPHAVGGTEGCCLCPEHQPISGPSTEQRSSLHPWLGLTPSWKAESLFVRSQATAVPWGAEANGTAGTQRDRPTAAPLLPRARGRAPQDARRPPEHRHPRHQTPPALQTRGSGPRERASYKTPG